MSKNINGRLSQWQWICLFVTVLLFPIQSLVAIRESFISYFLFLGYVSSIPILVGLILTIVILIREGKLRSGLLPVVFLGIAYLVCCMGISLNSIFQYASVGTFDARTFGEGGRYTQLAKAIFLSLGIESDTLVYGIIVFLKETKSSFLEFIYLYGLSLWLLYLFRRDGKATFEIIRKAILWDVIILTPYVFLEVLHLYDVEVATNLLKAINSLLYKPGYIMGDNPPIVSPWQVRATLMEPGFFSYWLVFATPFIISYFLENEKFQKRRILGTVLFFTVFWSVWLMTYARTATVLVLVVFVFYVFFTIFFHKRRDWKPLGVLVGTLFFAFILVASCGPEEVRKSRVVSQPLVQSEPLNVTSISRSQPAAVPKSVQSESPKSTSISKLEKQVKESELLRNTVLSSFDMKSRSNPTRIQQFLLELEAFKDHPIAGYGEIFSSFGLRKKMEENKSNLTAEWKLRLGYTERDGFFMSGIKASPFSFSGCLVCRGLIGFSILFVPIFLLGFVLFFQILKTGTGISDRRVCIFVASAGSFLAAFSQTLVFFYFWTVAGMALGMVLSKPSKITKL